MNLKIGIDTGVKTGFSVWESDSKKFLAIQTLKIHEAMFEVLQYNKSVEAGFCESLTVYFEDARLRKWYGDRATQKMQGAGSIKRDAKIWEDYLTDMEIDFKPIAPAKGMTKMKAEPFKKLTKWDKRVSEHARDAALIVFGMR
jgi:hypothetical protein